MIPRARDVCWVGSRWSFEQEWPRWYTINWMVEFMSSLQYTYILSLYNSWRLKFTLDGSTQYDQVLLSCNAYGWMPTNPDWGLHLVFYTECNPQTFERVFLCILQFARETCWPLVFLSDFLVCGKIRLEVNKLCWAVSKEIRQSLGSSILGSVS